MKTKKYSLLFLLLFIIPETLFYGQSMDAQSQTVKEQSRHIPSVSPCELDMPTEAEEIEKWKALSDGFGRKNPFMPLTAENIGVSVLYKGSIENKAVQEKVSINNREPSIRLTAVLIAGKAGGRGNVATIEENGISRSISVGDAVAGMEVMDIQRGKVVLGNKDKKLTMILGTPF